MSDYECISKHRLLFEGNGIKPKKMHLYKHVAVKLPAVVRKPWITCSLSSCRRMIFYRVFTQTEPFWTPSHLG